MLNTTVQYGIIVTQELARVKRETPGELVRAYDMAGKLNLSPTFLDQVIRKMRRDGMVKSHRGPGGGYSLIRDDITVGDLIKTLSPSSKRELEPAHETIRDVVDALNNIRVH